VRLTLARFVAGLALLGIAEARDARAQDDATVRGIVIDAATSRPVVGAIVRLGPANNQRMTRTDESGAFQFSRVPILSFALDVRALGFAVSQRMIEVMSNADAITVAMNRIAQLDTVHVREGRQALYGVVGSANTLEPLPKATLQIVGKGRVAIDSSGHFSVPIDRIGTYVLRAKAPGYAPQTLSVIVSPNEGREVSMLLDSTGKASLNRLESAFQDFDSRYKTLGMLSAIVPRTELMRDPGGDLVRAIRFSRSFSNKNLRFGSAACVFVDGIAQPTRPLTSFSAEDVEAVEVYGPNPRKSDRTGSLAAAWPKGFPCPTSGQAWVRAGDDVVQWVVVWMKR
jgi:hypothetical protein